jgi:hypothetical protein
MAVREAPTQVVPSPESSSSYPAEKARGGEIILRSRTRRIIFITGLAGAVILGFLLTLFTLMR